MLEIMQRHGLEVPGAMTVLSRALLTLEGTLRTIDPSFNIAHEATALLPELADQKSEMLQQQLEKEVVRALPSLRTLPGEHRGHRHPAARGRLSMRVERFAGADREIVDAWVDRIIFAAIGIFGLLASAVLLVAAAVVGTMTRTSSHRAAADRVLRHHRHVGDPDACRRADSSAASDQQGRRRV